MVRLLVEETLEGQKQKAPAQSDFLADGVFHNWPAKLSTQEFDVNEGGIVTRRRVSYNRRGSIGAGEEYVAALLGPDAEIGGSQSFGFDVSFGDQRWEVKEPSEYNIIRAGGESIEATNDFRAEILNLTKILERIKNLPEAESYFSKELNKMLADFFAGSNSPGPSIRRGNIARSRTKEIVNLINKINEEVDSRESPASTRTSVMIGDKEFEVSPMQLRKIMSIVTGNWRDNILDLIEHDAFVYPENWIAAQWETITPEAVFKKATGVVLVNPVGYQAFSSNDLSSVMKFAGIAGARATFKCTWGSKGTGTGKE